MAESASETPADESSAYQIVIGLEVHVQLLTDTKLFCRCSAQFGAEPNTQTCPVCIGMPGALPVMNRKAFDLALRTALALDCEIPAFTKWDRKNYFYPDLPKGYQISQFDLPMSQDGGLDIHDAKGAFEPKRIGIIRAHLEEDAGKSMHDERAGRADSRIDLNRTGTPLLEIVSEPDMRSPAEARAYLNELKLLLGYLGVSDCNMEQGSLRVDANINLHILTDEGVVATPIVEVKNVNSFRAVERALAYEAVRQYDEWLDTRQSIDDAPKRTFGWDDQRQVTAPQREKEDSADYRYFPDPDLAPVLVSNSQCETIRETLGELPAELRVRLQSDYGLDSDEADVMVNQGAEFASYFEDLAHASDDPKRASNWMQQTVMRTLNEQARSIGDFPISARQLAGLLKTIDAGSLNTTRAKDVFQEMLAKQIDVETAMKSLGIVEVDSSELTLLCRDLLDANPKIVADLKGGKQQAMGALIGQAKRINPNANPAHIRATCLELIEQMGP
jgi:aspartyl-tRNA(Asn)/glutamyl-tRNA(Gln) amidotransferase subunit B